MKSNLDEGVFGIGVLGYLDNFSCVISVILISKCGIGYFQKARDAVFITFWTVLKIILLVLRRSRSLFQFPIGLSIHGNGNLQFLMMT